MLVMSLENDKAIVPAWLTLSFFFFEKSHSEFELPHSQCQYTFISYSNYIIESFVVILQIKEDCEQLFLVNSSKDCASD